MFAEFDKVVTCLALELPSPVWDDVNSKYRSLKAKVEKFTSTNIARDEICPHRDTWTIISADGDVMYKIPACIKGGQTSPVA
jgi:hypothetical protein